MVSFTPLVKTGSSSDLGERKRIEDKSSVTPTRNVPLE